MKFIKLSIFLVSKTGEYKLSQSSILFSTLRSYIRVSVLYFSVVYEAKFDPFYAAYEFYEMYTELDGFPTKKNMIKSTENSIARSIGGSTSRRLGDDHRTSNTSKHDRCKKKAMVCARTAGMDGVTFYVDCALA